MTTDRLDDRAYLRGQQYRTDANLSARIALHQRFSTAGDTWFQWLFDRLNLADGAHVLELGCGRGDLWYENRQRLRPSWQLVLTDLSDGMVASAQERLETTAPQTTFSIADAQALPFADASFDTVVANHMLYHVLDRPRAFREIRRVLKPGGTFIAATNGSRHLRELDDLIARHTSDPATPAEPVGFTLDNGAAQLQPWFGEIGRDVFPDGLKVTDVEALIAYVRSTRDGGHLDPIQLDALATEVAARIATDGAFLVSKEVGLFRCRMKNSA